MAAIELSIATGIIGAVYAAGWYYEQKSRSKKLVFKGNNNLTETDCDLLCKQMKDRWNELCLAKADEKYLKERYQVALASAAVAQGTALAATVAANIALASILGASLFFPLLVIALAAQAAAVFAFGIATSAYWAWMEASTSVSDLNKKHSEARNQLANSCGQNRLSQCLAEIPSCPYD